MSRERTFAKGRVARFAAVAVGLGFAVAAAMSAARPFSGLAETKSARWPFHTAEAAVFALFALLAIAGAFVHRALLAEGAIVLIGYFVGNYESESVVAPAVAVAAAVFAIAFFRSPGAIAALGPRRIALVGASTLFGLAPIIAMQAPGGILAWQRVRTSSGGVDVRVFRTTGDCAIYRDVPKDASEIDSGCTQVISARRARYVVGYAAASAFLALAAVAGARRKREEIEA